MQSFTDTANKLLKGNILDHIVNDMPLHQNAYIRGVLNAVMPSFRDEGTTFTENNMSGEMLEFLKLIKDEVAPDLSEGDVVPVKYKDINEMFNLNSVFEDYQVNGLGDQVKMALGNFALAMQDGEVYVLDRYDFKRTVLSDSTLSEAMDLDGEYETNYHRARWLGERLMGDATTGASAEDLEGRMRWRVKLPRDPDVVNIDFDDEPEGDFTFSGPMTNKRQTLFGRFKDTLVTSGAPAPTTTKG